MTSKREDREALIERAAKAVLDAAETPENIRDEQVWEWARRDARAALAVFEQAHTPTDDEREARALIAEVKAYPPVAQWDEPGEVDAVLARLTGALASALRRPVQGEPTAEEWRASIVDERCRQFTKGYGVDHDREHGVNHLLVWAQDYARRGEPLKSAALVEAARELLAQGEPTDAEVRAAVNAWHRTEGTEREDWYDNPINRERMRLALRAAAAVTEQGENRG